MILLIFMAVLIAGALLHRDVRAHVRHSFGLGGERAHDKFNTLNKAVGCDDHIRDWTALDDLQLDRLLKDSAS